MFSPKAIDDITRKILDALPAGARDLQRDLEASTRQAVQATLARLDLVTREEFEVQRQVLLKTREKLEALEAQVRDLESRS